MKLAIADPPYLGRADRWYGNGRGSGRTRTTTRGRNGLKPDHHPDAHLYDNPETHIKLIHHLHTTYDGWALAGHASSTQLLLNAAPATARLAIWFRRNALPGGSRVINSWEPVVYCPPPTRRNRSAGSQVRDVLDAPVRRQGFLGSKPPEWTRWVLELLGYDPTTGSIDDVFPGSHAVSNASDGMLI